MPPPEIALITTNPEVICGEEADLPIIVPALRAVGIHAHPTVWHDTSVDWARYSALVMRSPWDYPERLDEFLKWLEERSSQQTIMNCRETIVWNLDKSYLLELEAEGVQIVPASMSDTIDDVVTAVRGIDTAQIIVKPNVSVGSRDTGRFQPDDESLTTLATSILDSGRRVLVQPCIPGVEHVGEHSLVYFDGEFSHAFRKGPILALGGGFLGGSYTENISAAVPSQAEIDLADAATVAIVSLRTLHGCKCSEPAPLYTRFDIVQTDDGPQLLEAELFEPSYFLGTSPGAEMRFAHALARRLGSDSEDPVHGTA